TRLRSIAAEIPDAARRAQAEALFDRVESTAVETRRRLSPAALAETIAPIASMLQDLRAARALERDSDGGARMSPDEKTAASEAALAAAAGVTLDAVSENETACPGEGFPTTVSVWNAGGEPVEAQSVVLESPDGWTVPSGAEAPRSVAPGTLA